MPVFQTHDGQVFPQRKGWATRVVLFDASAHEAHEGRSEETQSQSPFQYHRPHLQKNGRPEPFQAPRPHLDRDGRPEHRSIQSVVAADMADPRCAQYRERLEEEFSKVFQTQKIKDLDFLSRGPEEISIHKIRLKPDAVPKKAAPFRALGLREAALRALVTKFEERGMLR